MPIEVTCSCGKRYQLKDAFEGKTVICRNCKTRIHVPTVGSGVAAREVTSTRHDPAVSVNSRVKSNQEEFKSDKNFVRKLLGYSRIQWPEKIVDRALASLDAEFDRPNRSWLRIGWYLPLALIKLSIAQLKLLRDPLIVVERKEKSVSEFWRIRFDDDVVTFQRMAGDASVRIERSEQDHQIQFVEVNDRSSVKGPWNLLVNGDRKFYLRKKALRTLQKWVGLKPAHSAAVMFLMFSFGFAVSAAAGIVISNAANDIFEFGWTTEEKIGYGTIAGAILLTLAGGRVR